MQNRDRAVQIVKRAGSRRLGSDPGFSLFIEIVAREAVRSITSHEEAQPRMCAGPDASIINKKPSPGITPSAIAQGPEEPASSRPANPTEGKARFPAARQERLFD